jgi:hypothetical protein
MKLLVVHPSCLMYSKIYLRLEPLGLELVAAAARKEGMTFRSLTNNRRHSGIISASLIDGRRTRLLIPATT